MTKIAYDEDEMRMSISGHAQAGEYGKDIVCAAESILLLTIEAALEDRRDILLPTIRKKPGEALIFCDPEPENEKTCREIMRTVFLGFELLSNWYPNNVQARAINRDWREE